VLSFWLEAGQQSRLFDRSKNSERDNRSKNSALEPKPLIDKFPNGWTCAALRGGMSASQPRDQPQEITPLQFGAGPTKHFNRRIIIEEGSA
jgi:hypothetical protein